MKRQVLKTVRSIFYVIIGFALGVIFYSQLSSYFFTRNQDASDSDNVNLVSTGSPDSLQQVSGSNYEDSDELTRQEIGNLVSFQRTNAITKAVEKISPAVVSINVMKVRGYSSRNPYYGDHRNLFREFFRLNPQQEPVVGSGFIVTEDGYVITNEHVVLNASEIIVATADGLEYSAELVGSDRLYDIALLKIKKEDMPFIPFGDSDDIYIGEWAIALGNPFGLFVKSNPTVTIGVISALNRDFSPYEGRVYENMIQTDAAINNGNSGGPLCNILGQVIGMNTFIVTGETGTRGNVGIGFAIPSNRIQQIIKELKENRGIDRDFWTGLYIDNLTGYLARRLGYPSNEGAVVTHVDKKSSAHRNGIRVGDIVVGVNEEEVRNASEAQSIILSADLRVGNRLKIQVWREGKIYDREILLEKRARTR